LKRLGLENEKLSVRMTGCPNGCARPYQSDIGLVGRSGDKFTIFVGGHVLGHRLNFQLKDLVVRDDIVPTLVPLLENFQRERRPDESFGDYCRRQGVDGLQEIIAQAAARPVPPGGVLVNGHASSSSNGKQSPPAGAASHPAAAPPAQPETKPIPPGLVELLVAPKAVPSPEGKKSSERFLAGGCGEELVDYLVRYDSSGRACYTIVYFYQGDLRARDAHPGLAVYRKAVYRNSADPARLYGARKLSDTYYVGPPGQERKDYRIDYHPDGAVAQTTVYLYQGDARASQALSAAALRRHVVYAGKIGEPAPT
jgi:Nitrite and sulphite reductase 4Fe-4S domain